MKRHIYIWSVLIVLFPGCKSHREKNVLTSKLDAYLKETVMRFNIPGLTVAATRNDTIVYLAGFGVRSMDTGEPMKPEDVFHWASVSKTFVATAILQLVEQGKINLDEKLITYLPYFRQKDPNYRMITIRQMLNHTSGVADVEDYEWDKPQYDEGAPERYVRSLANDTLLYAPGKGWSYSNTAFNVLGDVITKVSGIPFETYVKRNIFEPLEMANTTFIYPEVPDSLRVTPHIWAAKVMTTHVYPYNRIHAPSGCLNSSALEMTHYALANLHHGQYKDVRILSDSSYDLLWTNSVKVKNKPAVGISWFLDEYKGLKIVSHGGHDTGFRSYLLLSPDRHLSVEVSSNYDLAPTNKIAYAVLDFLLGDEPAAIRQQIGIRFAEVLKEEGLEKARTFFVTTREDSAKSKYFLWNEDDGSLGYPGYVLLDQGLVKEALELFKYNAELNPTSSYAHTHAGVGYARLGMKDSARINLRKSIEMDSSNYYAKDELRKLNKEDTPQIR